MSIISTIIISKLYETKTYFITGSINSECFTKAQTVEIKLQAIIDSIYKLNPASVGILLHVESPEKGISWSGASGYTGKDNQTLLEPDQPGLIASNIKTFVAASILRLV